MRRTLRRYVPAISRNRARFLLLAVCLLAGCNTPTDPSDAGTRGGESVIATVDGFPFRAIGTLIAHDTPGTDVSMLSLGASDERFTFGLVVNHKGVGTYTVGSGTIRATLSNLLVPQSGLATGTNGGSGTVTITTLTSSRAVGTFDLTLTAPGTATSTSRIANGHFDVKLF